MKKNSLKSVKRPGKTGIKLLIFFGGKFLQELYYQKLDFQYSLNRNVIRLFLYTNCFIYPYFLQPNIPSPIQNENSPWSRSNVIPLIQITSYDYTSFEFLIVRMYRNKFHPRIYHKGFLFSESNYLLVSSARFSSPRLEYKLTCDGVVTCIIRQKLSKKKLCAFVYVILFFKRERDQRVTFFLVNVEPEFIFLHNMPQLR